MWWLIAESPGCKARRSLLRSKTLGLRGEGMERPGDQVILGEFARQDLLPAHHVGAVTQIHMRPPYCAR